MQMLGALMRKKGWLGALTAGLLLFAQIVTAAQACTLAAQPFAPQHAMSDASCDGMPLDAAECLAHCGAQEQAAAPDHSFHVDQVAVANFIAPFALPAIRGTSRLAPWKCPGPAGPPLQVLYCSYQL